MAAIRSNSFGGDRGGGEVGGYEDTESELSLVEVEIPSRTTAVNGHQVVQTHRNGGVSTSFSRLESNKTNTLTATGSNKQQSDLSSSSASGVSGNGSGSGVKLEKRIRLNYGKQSSNINNVNLLNFGTLC